MAVLPSPRRFALMFIEIASNAALFLSSLGNSGRSSGAKSRAASAFSPLRSAIFISPDQRQIIPARVSRSCMASAALSTKAFDRF